MPVNSMSAISTLPLANVTYENSVVLLFFHFSSIAEKMGVGTGYSEMKLPLVSGTLRVTPRLIVCRLLHADSTPVDAVETVERGRAYGSPNASGSTGLQDR